MKPRGARADEFLQVLKAIWTNDPVEFEGRFYRIPRSVIRPKSVQKPHPPIYLAAFAPPALRRVATAADGWNPAGIPVAGMKQMFDSVREMARAAGRDPGASRLTIRANVEVSQSPLPESRAVFNGTLAQIREDVEARKIGAHELFFDPTFQPVAQKLERWLELMAELRKLA